MKNICFVANYTRTYTFNEIGKGLRNEGIGVYWIVTNKKQLKMLQETYGKSNVLYLNKEYINIQNEPVGDIKVNEILFGDRFYSHFKKDGKKLLTNIQKPIYDFLENNKISFVFGEITWAHELITHRLTALVKSVKCKYLFPTTIRIPSERFAFFEDEYASKIYEIKNKKKENVQISVEKPEYFFRNNNIIAGKKSLSYLSKKLYNFLFRPGKDSMDITWEGLNRKISLVNNVNTHINMYMYKFVKTENLDFVKDKKFIFVTLHKRPEASVDNVGRYYENEFNNIVNLWRILPSGWSIFVKEHNNAIGDRSLLFFKRLQKYPNVHIINENIDSHDLIKRCEAVATVSGTSALEAGLMGKNALTFADTFFNKLPFVKKVSLEDFRKISSYFDLIPKDSDREEDISKFKEYMVENSFEGFVGSPLYEQHCGTVENIAKVTGAFLTVIHDIGE